MQSVYKNSLKFHGPYAVDDMKVFVVHDENATYLFHRESAKWLKIKAPDINTNWNYYLSTNKNVFAKLFTSQDAIKELDTTFKPDALILFPTETCNLRCLYCHCDSTIGLDMTQECAVNAIDGYLSNYAYNGRAHLGFSGGGEPTINMPLLKHSTAYFKERCTALGFKSSTNTVTNGCCSEDNAKWLLEHMDHVTISFDGLPKIQDHQRPLATGLSSYNYIERFMETAVRINKKVGIRISLSFDNINKLSEMMAFASTLPTKFIAIEAIYKTGRGKLLDYGGSEDYNAFFDELLKYPGQITNSLVSPFSKKTSFCGAARGNLIVTPKSYVSLCTEISEKDDLLAESALVGDIKNNSINIDYQKFSLFQDNVKRLTESCENCIVKYKCGGGCYAKRWRGYSTDDPSLCESIQKANLSLLLNSFCGGINAIN